MLRQLSFVFGIGLLLAPATGSAADAQRRLYVVTPGIRNYLEFGGAGVLVFDMDQNFRFLKRISTPASSVEKPENIKGVCASAATGRLYFTTLTRLYCLDLVSEKPLWDHALSGGCDRLAITPDGRKLFVPSLEGPHWHVVAGDNGAILETIIPNSGAHNTVCSLDGKRAFLAGLKSPHLTIVNTESNQVAGTCGPFSASIRPFTVNADRSRCFVNVNGLIGFEVGDLITGKFLHRVEVPGFKQGPVKRHGCPSHGIGLTPDEKEAWVCDGHNSRMHIFDLTRVPPKWSASLPVREQPGWVTFSLNGHWALPSTGEIFDVRSRELVATLTDETARPVHSEKMVEIHFADGRPVRTGDQFGLGRSGLQIAQDRQPDGAPFVPKQSSLPVPSPAGAIVLLNEKINRFVSMAGTTSDWPMLDGCLVSTLTKKIERSNHVPSTWHFRDADLHVEFQLPNAGECNSGVYLHGNYEMQICNSFGAKQLTAKETMGSLYGFAAPLVNASLPYGQWQTYDIRYRAPRRDAGGKITQPGFVSAWLNGKLVQDNVAFTEPRSRFHPYRYGVTPYLKKIADRQRKTGAGPVFLQDHDSPVRFRNIWALPRDDEHGHYDAETNTVRK